MSITIYDIAKASGVSIATVSRVLNGSNKVSDTTREKVLAVMEQQNYTPNVFARGLGLDSMKMVGILCTDVSDMFYAKAVSLVEEALRKQGFDILLCCTGQDVKDKEKYLSLLLEKRVDAVVLIGSVFQEASSNQHIGKAAEKVPVIIINGWISLPGVSCVYCDEKAAVSENVVRLASKKHEKILYLYDADTFSGAQKRAGLKEGLARCGLDESFASVLKVENSVNGAENAVMEAIRQNLVFDAVMASEDVLAIGALKGLARFGRTMPVIGFNNSLLAQCATPALTSVDNMLESMCSTAVNLLTSILSGKQVPDKTVVSAQLVVRETFIP